MNPKRFYLTRDSDNISKFPEVIKAQPIVWCRDGEYRIVPKEVVQNALTIRNMYEAFSDKRTCPEVVILWNQGIPISNLAGRALIGE